MKKLSFAIGDRVARTDTAVRSVSIVTGLKIVDGKILYTVDHAYEFGSDQVTLHKRASIKSLSYALSKHEPDRQEPLIEGVTERLFDDGLLRIYLGTVDFALMTDTERLLWPEQLRKFKFLGPDNALRYENVRSIQRCWPGADNIWTTRRCAEDSGQLSAWLNYIQPFRGIDVQVTAAGLGSLLVPDTDGSMMAVRHIVMQANVGILCGSVIWTELFNGTLSDLPEGSVIDLPKSLAHGFDRKTFVLAEVEAMIVIEELLRRYKQHCRDLNGRVIYRDFDLGDQHANL